MTNTSGLPLTTAHWGTYRAESRDGKVVALHGFEDDPDVSPIAQGMIDTQDDRLRIRAPMVRKSWLESGRGSHTERRGTDPFVEVTVEEADRLVANELSWARDTHGNSAIYGGSYGWASAGRFHHAQSQLHRFLNCIGGYTSSVNTYSFAAAEVVVPHVIGDFWGSLGATTAWPSIASDCTLFVALGGVPLKNGQITPGGVGRHGQREGLMAAADAGVRFVNVGPIRSDIDSAVGASWMPIRPSTDTALLLALAHTLVVEGLADLEFLETHCSGTDRFLAYLHGETDGVTKDAQWAAAITSVGDEEILALARDMARGRTMISISWSLTRQDHGEQAYWAAISLAAVLGHIGLPGGGFGFGYSASNNVGDHFRSIPTMSLPQGHNPVESFIPVARLADMLLDPGAPFDYDGGRYEYPDVELIYWTGGNPFHHHQDLNRLGRAWRKPQTIIVHDWCWNSLARHADIVMPCTTTLEREDIAMSPYDPYVIPTQRVAEPVGESRDDYEIFASIAGHLGVRDEFTEGRDVKDWLPVLYAQTRDRAATSGITMPTYDELRNGAGWYKAPTPADPGVLLAEFRGSPENAPLATPTGRIELFSDAVAAFGYDDCPGHAAWTEPVEWLGHKDAGTGLHLISNQPATKLHSQLDHGSVSVEGKVRGREPLRIHPHDAQDRDLRDGDIVRVFNARGACLAGVVVSDDVRPGVVQMSTGAWLDPDPGDETTCKHGNVNVLTLDKGTSRLAQGPIAHTCLVDVEREDNPPDSTAFTPPKIER